MLAYKMRNCSGLYGFIGQYQHLHTVQLDSFSTGDAFTSDGSGRGRFM